MKRILCGIGLAFLLASCGSSAAGVEPGNLAAGTYRITLDDEETRVFTGSARAVEDGDDIRLEIPLRDEAGVDYALIILAMPSGTTPTDYQLCYLHLYEVDQCPVGHDIGVEVQAPVDGRMTAQREFGSGNVELVSLNPLTASFRMAPSFGDGSGFILSGAVNQIPVE